MAARKRGVVRMMTRTTTTHPKGVNWKDLESGKLEGKKKRLEPGKLGKKKKTNTYILTFA
jgi:hypothetical protein